MSESVITPGSPTTSPNQNRAIYAVNRAHMDIGLNLQGADRARFIVALVRALNEDNLVVFWDDKNELAGFAANTLRRAEICDAMYQASPLKSAAEATWKARAGILVDMAARLMALEESLGRGA